jgi:hypothetical protein
LRQRCADALKAGPERERRHCASAERRLNDKRHGGLQQDGYSDLESRFNQGGRTK